MNTLTRIVSARPRLIAVLAVVFVVVAGAFGGTVFERLDPFGFTDPDSESVIAEEELASASGEEPTPGVIALVEPGGQVESAAGRAAVADVVEAAEADPAVTRVVSVLDGPDPGIVSEDGETTYVSIFTSAGDDDATEQLVEELEPLPGVTLGGEDVTQMQIGEQVESDLRTAELMAFPLLALISFFVFRSLVASLLPLMVGGLAIVGSLFGLRLLVEATDISIFSVNLIIGLGLGLAIDYSLFIVSRYREEMAEHGAGVTALARTMRTAGRTVVFSSLTVAAALASLLIFPQLFLRSMGIGGTLVSLLAAAAALVVLPAVLLLLGERVNALSPRWMRRASDAEARHVEGGRWYRFSRWVMRRPGKIAIVTALLMVVAGLPFLRSEHRFADAQILPASLSAGAVDDTLRAEFNPRRFDAGVVAVDASKGDRAEVAEVARLAAAQRDAALVTPPVYVGDDVWRFDVQFAVDPNSDRGQELVEDLRDIRAPVPFSVAGTGAALADQKESLSAHLVIAVAILAVTTLVLLFLMTGSVVLPVKALIMNLLTVSVAFGILVLIFQDGRLEGLLGYDSLGALDISQPILLFVMIFGLSTDYGVFLLTRIKEARDAGAGERESVAIGLERTGRIVTFAAILFSIAIGAFVTSEIVFLKQVGLGTALGVLIDATIVRALLVPSLMALLGRWNWWSPRPLRRLHARFGITESPAQ
ncbi:MMPL family transporter [Thermoleophilia bacterium SCSIO 60948]|nr:MMPL family transporter [Thermoleophilia bacterium SCSIO 60948]